MVCCLVLRYLYTKFYLVKPEVKSEQPQTTQFVKPEQDSLAKPEQDAPLSPTLATTPSSARPKMTIPHNASMDAFTTNKDRSLQSQVLNNPASSHKKPPPAKTIPTTTTPTATSPTATTPTATTLTATTPTATTPTATTTTTPITTNPTTTPLTTQQAGAGTKKSIFFSPQATANAGLAATPTSNTTVATTATAPKPIVRGQQSTKPAPTLSLAKPGLRNASK
jgi:hypothetical protein